MAVKNIAITRAVVMGNWRRRTVKRGTQYNPMRRSHKNVKKIILQCFAEVVEDLDKTSDTKRPPYNRWRVNTQRLSHVAKSLSLTHQARKIPLLEHLNTVNLH